MRRFEDFSNHELDQLVAHAVHIGIFDPPTEDGVYKLTDDGYRYLHEFFEKHPEAYPQVFKDRLQ